MTIQTKAQAWGNSPLAINPPSAAAPQPTEAQPQDHKGQESDMAAETGRKHLKPNMSDISSPSNPDSIFKEKPGYQYSKHKNNISSDDESSDMADEITDGKKDNKS